MSSKDRQIPYMANFSHVDKWPKDKPFYLYNNEFERVQTDGYQLYKTLTSGFGVAPDCEGAKRHSDNFIAGWYIGLDFDTEDINSDIRTLASDPIVKRYAAFIYTTPSHTDERPRCRVIFILDRPITNAKGYKKAVTALQYMFPHCDQSAKDAARLFYGCSDCLSVQIWQTLPAAELIKFYEWHRERITAAQNEQRATIKANNGQSTTSNPNDVLGAFCHLIATASPGYRHNTVNKMAYTIGGFVGSGRLSEQEAYTAVCNAIDKMNTETPDKHKATAKRAISEGKGKPITA